jgi:hypothetical protein
VKAISLKLEWTKPSKADNLVDRGLNAGHVTEDEGRLSLTFQSESIDVPFGFAPSEELFDPVERPDTDDAASQEDAQHDRTGEAEAGSSLEAVLETIEEGLGWERNESMAAVNAKQQDLGNLVTIETAGLLVAAEHGLDVRDKAQRVLEDLQTA